MKKTIILALCLMMAAVVSAQTQHGYVKTKGRMVNGQLVPGQGLKGATISVQGRTTVIVNSEDGEFSFPVPDNTFRLDSVRKKGYQLVDMDACPKTYTYSGNPIYLVMETPDLKKDDSLAIAKKIRRTLERQLQDKEDELDNLREQHRISTEEYQNALTKLYEERERNDMLVKEMVDRYSKIDYDMLSETDRLISDYIVNGNLVKADSLLRSKGDINERLSQLRQHQDINENERNELEKREEKLRESEALVIKERDDLANDCFRKHEIFNMQRVYDSAVYFIELRAGLDTMNPQWQCDAASYYMMPKAASKMYYTRAYNIYKDLANDDHDQYDLKLAETTNALADCYGTNEQTRVDLREDAINLCRNYEQRHPMTVTNDAIWLKILKSLVNDYSANQRFDDISDLMVEMEMLATRLSDTEYVGPVANDDDYMQNLMYDVIDFYIVVANALYNKQDYEMAEKVYNQMLGYFDQFKVLNKTHLVLKIKAYWGLSDIYMATGRIDESETKLKDALALTERYSETAPILYYMLQAKTTFLLGIFYINTERYNDALTYLNQSVDACDELEKNGKETDEKVVILQLLSALYSEMQDYHSSYEVNKKLLALLKEQYESDNESWADTYSQVLTNQSYCAIYENEFEQAVWYAEEALRVNPDDHLAITNQAAALLFQGEYPDAERLYHRYKNEFKDSFLEDFDAFEAAGIIPESSRDDVEKIREMLRK